MYISRIEIHHIRCFEHLIIDLERAKDRIMWTTILGDNAVGKSTILKCIAMGLSDVSSASALMKEVSGDLIRRGEETATIKITLKKETTDSGVSIETEITQLSKDSPEEILQHVHSDNDIPWHEIFVCGYGTQLGAGGGNTFERYKQIEAVYTLFNDTSELPNPETIMRRQGLDVRNWLSEKLQEILLIKGYKEIEYNKKGMYVFGPWGKSRVEDLSDGYKTTIQLVVDFFGWQIVSDKIKNVDDEISGILLIDELETHLHPRWQRSIVNALRAQLPGVQVISTTHSPLIVLGTSDLEDALMVELDLIGKNKLHYQCLDPAFYRGFSVDQILTSSAFDLPISGSLITGDKLLRYKELFLLDTRDEDDEIEFSNLQKELEQNIPEVRADAESTALQKELIKKSQELLDRINSAKDDKTP